MKNLKKYALTLLVVGLAFGFSAFKNTPEKAKLASITYYHVGDQYVKDQPSGLECGLDDFSCEMRFDGANLPSVNSFPEATPPTSPDYTNTPIQANASYQ